MIPARKGRLFAAWFARDAERRIARSFDAVRVRGLSELEGAVAHGPVLVVSNHTSWWDALVVLMLTQRVIRSDSYAMMDASNLVKLPFFAKVGAFGVDLADPADGARAIRYAAKLLSAPGRLVWIFSQGRERPITARPLGFAAGSAQVARVASRAQVVPLALRYEMGEAERPSLYVSIGAPLPRVSDVEEARAAQEAAVTRELDRIDEALVSGDSRAFHVLVQRTPSRLFSVAQALLAWWARPRALA